MALPGREAKTALILARRFVALADGQYQFVPAKRAARGSAVCSRSIFRTMREVKFLAVAGAMREARCAS
jgi:hypothetical protein